MLKPLGDRVLVEIIEEAEQKTAGGLYVPDSAKEKSQRGKVVAVGTGKTLDNGTKVPMEVKEGDTVYFAKYGGTEVSLEGKNYSLLSERDLLAKALEDVQGTMGYMVGELMKSDPRQEGGDVTNLYKVGQNTTRFLLAAGDLVVGWLLVKQAAVAADALEAGASGKDVDFYTGKIAAAQFFARQVLPRLAAERAIAEASDNDLMEVPESAF